jgi:hypothetical protein
LAERSRDLCALKAYLFKPENGVRVRFGTNDPTPWPPEITAGENPPDGAIVDYYLPADAGEVKMEFLDGQGRVVRSYSSSDAVMKPDPATDPVAYNKLCQQTPNAPDCGLPLYWPAAPHVLKTTAGMHRFTWDMHYDVVAGTPAGGRGGDPAGAVPHRTYPSPHAPWVPPGSYTVRLTANGQTLTQPIVIKMDPRVKVTPEVQQIFALSAQMESQAHAAVKAHDELSALIATLKTGAQSEAVTARLKKLNDMDAELGAMGGKLIGAVMPLQGTEMPPTATELAACKKQSEEYAALMAKCAALKK